MEILNYSNDKTLQYLGGLQLRTVGKKYRFNKFCIKVEVEEGTLIYNGLSDVYRTKIFSVSES